MIFSYGEIFSFVSFSCNCTWLLFINSLICFCNMEKNFLFFHVITYILYCLGCRTYEDNKFFFFCADVYHMWSLAWRRSESRISHPKALWNIFVWFHEIVYVLINAMMALLRSLFSDNPTETICCGPLCSLPTHSTILLCQKRDLGAPGGLSH